ncbi:MAG: nicotinate-nucleotide adenylyltransferase [Gemmataceae bacterium]
MSRIGIFGGTFDPVHLGHLILAEQCREQGRLDEVWFVPAPRPPQKPGESISRFDLRAEMLSLALAGHPAFRVSEVEKDRPGPSYTVDTLAELHHLYTKDQFYLLVGGDSLADLPLWRDPAGIVARAGLLVMARPGSPLPSAEQLSRQIPGQPAVSVQAVEAPQIDIASRDLRRRIAEGRSVRYLTPRAVEVYIHEKKLYRG